MMKMLNIPYNNFKTQLCKFFEKEGKCKFGKNCQFAHGESELRKPYEMMSQENAPALMKNQMNNNGPNAERLPQNNPHYHQSQSNFEDSKLNKDTEFNEEMKNAS